MFIDDRLENNRMSQNIKLTVWSDMLEHVYDANYTSIY